MTNSNNSTGNITTQTDLRDRLIDGLKRMKLLEGSPAVDFDFPDYAQSEQSPKLSRNFRIDLVVDFVQESMDIDKKLNSIVSQVIEEVTHGINGQLVKAACDVEGYPDSHIVNRPRHSMDYYLMDSVRKAYGNENDGICLILSNEPHSTDFRGIPTYGIGSVRADVNSVTTLFLQPHSLNATILGFDLSETEPTESSPRVIHINMSLLVSRYPSRPSRLTPGVVIVKHRSVFEY